MSNLPVTQLDVVQGDTGRWSVTITDEVTGLPLNLTGCTLRLAVYYRTPIGTTTTDSAAEAVLTTGSGITISNPGAGGVDIVMPAATTSGLTVDYHTFDLQLTNTSSEIYTVASGYINVTPQITHNS